MIEPELKKLLKLRVNYTNNNTTQDNKYRIYKVNNSIECLSIWLVSISLLLYHEVTIQAPNFSYHTTLLGTPTEEFQRIAFKYKELCNILNRTVVLVGNAASIYCY